MSKKLGILCIVLGIACLLTAVAFVVYNDYEEKSGAATSMTLLENVQANIRKTETSVDTPTEPTQPEEMPDQDLPEMPIKPVTAPTIPEMATVPAGKYASIGILSIPVLELELPILADWSDEMLKSAPCLYYGSYYESDFVIAGHNYTAHFGRLSHLEPGDLILFTDATGTVHYYEVVLLETLAATATEEMITSGFDLSLYTCTLGGSNRITVRCKAINP